MIATFIIMSALVSFVAFVFYRFGYAVGRVKERGRLVRAYNEGGESGLVAYLVDTYLGKKEK